jgi:hypothetical protein
MEQRINNLEVEKEYILDQLAEAETELNRLRETVKAALSQRTTLEREL